MNWSALTKKQKNMVIATGVLAVIQILVLAHLFGWTRPSSGSRGSAREELADLEEKIEDARLLIARRKIITDELNASIADLETLTAYTPTRSDRYAWAYEYVSRAATQTGIELDSLEEVLFLGGEEDETDDSEKEPYQIRVSTLCGYNRLVEFIWRLEKGNPLLRIKDVEITAMRDLPERHQVRITLQWPAFVEIKRGGAE